MLKIEYFRLILSHNQDLKFKQLLRPLLAHILLLSSDSCVFKLYLYLSIKIINIILLGKIIHDSLISYT